MIEQTIELNNRSYPYREGATVGSLMVENNFDFSTIIVKINGNIIEENSWETMEIAVGDSVEIHHIFGGG